MNDLLCILIAPGHLLACGIECALRVWYGVDLHLAFVHYLICPFLFCVNAVAVVAREWFRG